MNTSDKKYFLISVSLHLAVILFLTVKVYFFPMERPEFIKSVRVDFVALPDKDPEEGPAGVEKPAEATKEEPVKPQEAAAPPAEKPAPKKEEALAKADKKKPDVKPKDEPKEPTKSKTKDQQSDALKRLEAIRKMKERRQSQQKEGPEGKEYKGNQVSVGNALTGVEQLQHDNYLGQLDPHIKKNWQLPEWLAQKDYAAAILVRFDEDGNILEKRLLRSSGNAAFDKEAMQAIVASAPFPKPPDNFVSYFKVRGVEIRFPQ